MYKVVEKAFSILKRWRILRGRVDILLVFKNIVYHQMAM